MSTPAFAEDSNLLKLAPNLSETLEKLSPNANKYEHLLAFLITIMAENCYRVACLYDQNKKVWSKEITCIPNGWMNTEKKIYEIDFLWYRRPDVGCKIIAILIGDWLILNLLPRGASSRCKTRSMTVNVLKHVNMYQKELGKFWHLKELALRFKNNLLAPLHGEIMIEIGIASPSLQGLPQEIKVLISKMLDESSQTNLELVCKEFSDLRHNHVLTY